MFSPTVLPVLSLSSRELEEKELVQEHADTFVRALHGHVPTLVPLNNVGLPIRVRRQPRRGQGP